MLLISGLAVIDIFDTLDTHVLFNFIKLYEGTSLVVLWLKKKSACQCGFNPWSGKILHVMGHLSLCPTTTAEPLL